MKPLLLLLILLLASGLAGAQAPRLAAPPDSLTVPLAIAPTAPDTVAALHRLFATKRKNNKRFLAGTAGVAAIGGVVLGTAPPGFIISEQAGLGIAIIAFVSFPAFVVEAVMAVEYSKKNEQRAIESYQAHQLPRHRVRQLKARYFR